MQDLFCKGLHRSWGPPTCSRPCTHPCFPPCILPALSPSPTHPAPPPSIPPSLHPSLLPPSLHPSTPHPSSILFPGGCVPGGRGRGCSDSPQSDWVRDSFSCPKPHEHTVCKFHLWLHHANSAVTISWESIGVEKDHLACRGLRLRPTGLLGVGFLTLRLKRHNTDLTRLVVSTITMKCKAMDWTPDRLPDGPPETGLGHCWGSSQEGL